MSGSPIAARYRAERPHLEAGLELWLRDLERIAFDIDRDAVVRGRVKSFRSLIGKLKLDTRDERSWDSIGDLIALKAIFPTLDAVDEFTARVCSVDGWSPSLDDRKVGATELGYTAKQIDVSRPDVSDSVGSSIKTEIQVRTFAGDSWYIVDHRLTYKSLVSLPASLQRKVKRLTVLGEMFDDEVAAVLAARADLEEYAVARVYETLSTEMDRIVDGMAKTSRPDGLFETCIAAYEEEEVGVMDGILVGFVEDYRDALVRVIRNHQFDSPGFVDRKDWLYSEPEAISIAERACLRPKRLEAAFRGSNYESVVTSMANEFRRELLS